MSLKRYFNCAGGYVLDLITKVVRRSVLVYLLKSRNNFVAWLFAFDHRKHNIQDVADRGCDFATFLGLERAPAYLRTPGRW